VVRLRSWLPARDARGLLPMLALLAAWAGGCAGHSDRTLKARSALDAGQPKVALAEYNEALGVENEKQPIVDVEDDQVLFVLDRSTVLQALDAYTLSSRDLELADKQIEVLDFSRSTLDDISKYMFTDEAGEYVAPAYEKLMINTMNMMNYLARGDLSGARVEARRLTVMQKFIADHEEQGQSLSGAGSYLAGFVFEKSGKPAEALRYYDEALQYGNYQSLADPVRRLSQLDSYTTPRLKALCGGEAAPPEDESAELLVIVNYGRVPARIAKRIPIGLALTFGALWLSPGSSTTANRLAAQGLVTWVNYPALGQPKGSYAVPEFWLDNRQLPLEGIVAVDTQVQQAYKQQEGKIIASAITRMITRVLAGEIARNASGGGTLGTLLSMGTQAAMVAADTPDTRSWSTLPARITFGRERLPPGRHDVRLVASGVSKRQALTLGPKGWGVLVLTVLR
jgi:tetratricopeptide (TPR) repeat protein